MKSHTARAYVFYDGQTGAIVGTHEYLNASTEPTTDEVRKMIHQIVGIANPERVEVLQVELPRVQRGRGYYVDVQRKVVVPRPTLRVEPAKTILRGDSEDTTEIAITVIDEHGKILSDFSGELQVITSRGKLSARGGRVTAQHGKATVTLTSVPETVHRVIVGAIDPSGRTARGAARLAFE